MLSPEGRVKVMDFGIAKAAVRADDLTTTGEVLGTVQYLSPEQVQGQEVDERSDVYAAGLVLYELVTGRVPFSAESNVATALLRLTKDPVPPRAVRPGLPKGLEAAIMRALARDPADRFPDAEAMRAAVERQGQGAPPTPPRGIPVSAPVAAASTAPVRTARRGSTFRSWMLIPLVVIVVAAAVIVGGLIVGRLQLGGPLGIRRSQASTGPGSANGSPIRIASVADFDPFGDGTEHPEDTHLAVDGDPATAWSTDHYSTAAFGQLKPGLGLFVSFGGTRHVDRVVIHSPLHGWTFELLPGSAPTSDARPVASVSGDFHFTVGTSGAADVELKGVQTGGLTIWITSLAPDQGRYAAAIGEVAVFGSSA
jgi:serine/threonine-protein kinase